MAKDSGLNDIGTAQFSVLGYQKVQCCLAFKKGVPSKGLDSFISLLDFFFFLLFLFSFLDTHFRFSCLSYQIDL